jgi:amino acid adenylation domain-containing protein
MTTGINTLFQPSPLQEWMLLTNTIRNCSLLITLNDNQPAASAHKLSTILQEQPALNSSFKCLGSNYYQSYDGNHPQPQPTLITLRDLDINDFVNSVPAITPSDFPLYTLYLVHPEEPSSEYHLLLVISSLLADNYSLRQIFDRFISPEDIGFPPPNDPSIHVPAGQHHEAATESQTGRQAYWEKLLNEPFYTKINFPIDYLADKRRSDLQQLSFDLPDNIYKSISGACKRYNILPRHYYLGIYLILLYKYSSGTDIIAAIYSSYRGNRDDRRIENLDNILPVRFLIAPEDTFIRFAARITELCNISEANSLPLKQLLGLAKNPHLLDYGYNFSELPPIPGTDQTPTRQTRSGNYGELLTLMAEDNGETVRLTFLYDPSSYRHSTILLLKEYWQKMIADLTGNIHIALGDISILTPNERQKILFEYNRPDIRIDRPHTVIELFEATATRFPEKLAVIFKDTRMSYHDLAAKVDHLAAILAVKGDFYGQIIAVYLPRSIDHLVAMLAIFKTGGIYLPIPDNNPDKRNIQIINDSQPAVLITAGSDYKILDSAKDQYWPIPHILFMDDLPRGNIGPINNRCSLPDAAYMVYTSGSTGTSKGAVNRHDGLVNQLLSKIESMGLPPGFRLLQTAPLSSDVSIWQFLAALCREGTTVICDEFYLHIQPLLHELITKEGLTIVEWVPSLLNLYLEWLETLPSVTFPALTTVMVTGEDLPKGLVNKCLRLIPDITVANAYGPTETSDDVTVFTITSPLSSNTIRVPIGRPINNVFIVILNDDLSLCPTGVIGEIAVIGVAVGNGYWNDPQKTARKFIDNPFPEIPGKTLYRTNDFGRWLSDGTIEFHGRIDNQVKINGNRIELGEIESTLAGFPGIGEAIVEIKSQVRNEKTEKKLIAFYTAHTNISHAEFNKFMLERLPPYMVPSQFNKVDKFPLNSNGKIDRKNLITNI